MNVLSNTKTQVNNIPRVAGDLCQVCRKCLARQVCRSKAIVRVDPGEPPCIDASLCYGCHVCIHACPNGAIHLSGG